MVYIYEGRNEGTREGDEGEKKVYLISFIIIIIIDNIYIISQDTFILLTVWQKWVLNIATKLHLP